MSIREDLKAWIDGELPPDRAREVQAAVDSDPALEQEVRFMRLLSSEIAGAGAQAEVKGAEKAVEAVKGRKGMPLSSALAWGLIFLLVIGGTQLVPPLSSTREAAKMASSKSIDVQNKLAEDIQNELAGADGGGAKPERASRDTELYASTAPPLGLERKIIRSADLRLRVADVSIAQSEAAKIASSLGGFLTASSLSGTQGDVPVADAFLRVPVKQFDTAVSRLEKLGTVLERSFSGNDVTAQHADLTARVKVMRAEEESYITMLRAARKVGELLEIKERLSRVRQEIESLDSQAKVLKELADLSTINVRFETKPKIGEPKPADDWTDSTWTSAVNALKEAGRIIGQGIIFLFVLAPVWIPVGLVFWWIARRARR